MKRSVRRNEGYILMDVLTALFLLSLGFAAFLGMNEGAVSETNQAANLCQAANIAQSKMEELAAGSWQENMDEGLCVPGEEVQGTEGKFRWTVDTDWGSPAAIIDVRISVEWLEQGQNRKYVLESMYDVWP